MENFIVIHHISSFPLWNSLLENALELADSFGVVYPHGDFDKENPLLTGKPELEQFDLTREPWPNMKDAGIYTSRLSLASKDFIKKYMIDDPGKATYPLWNFSLYKNGTEILNVQDFSVCLIKSDTELTAMLDQQDPNWRNKL